MLTPLEDLESRTLLAIPGVLRKLAYVIALRRGGRYHHWGLGLIHGVKAAESALAETHSQLLLKVLRLGLGELTDELFAFPGKPRDILQLLSCDSALPANLDVVYLRHYRVIVDALLLLADPRVAA
jgi:hypothetical protein